MKVSVEEPHSYQKVLTIEIPAESIDSEIENIYSKIKETATHPGFRKGKVPRKILEKKFNKTYDVMLSYGKTQASQGSFEANTLTMSLSVRFTSMAWK